MYTYHIHILVQAEKSGDNKANSGYLWWGDYDLNTFFNFKKN